ncbi:hypothetical protein QJS10_CPB15g00005 [Acorus calamus]|uniref:TF-B3 domain-containing protein n=1 Tax=Acorus calamus TaxID=4465 RepID=A0AAV9D5J6_ACOCL|nr:hypothetical protein QJS10_CPB15g00005 [Acorus calamus]
MTDASLNVSTRTSVGLSGLRGGGRAIMNNPMIKSISGVQIPRPPRPNIVSAAVASRPPASEFTQGYHMNMASNIIDVQQVQVTVGRFEVPAAPPAVLQLPTAIQTRAGPVSITPKPPLLTQATRDPPNYGYNSTFSHASMKTQEVNVPRESQNSWINNGVSRTSHSTQAQNVVLKDFSMSSMIHNNTHNIDFQSSSIYADQQQVSNAAGDISTSSQTFVPPQSELNLRYPLLNFSERGDNKELEVLRMIPIIQKELQNSDVSHLGRIVLPKKDAETLLPQLSEREGLTLYMEDVVFPIIWKFKYRFWPNNRSAFIRMHGLQKGDIFTIYKDMVSGIHIVDGKKICRPTDNTGDQVATIKLPRNANGANNDNYEQISPSVSEGASVARSEPVTSSMKVSSIVNKNGNGLPQFDMNSLGIEADDAYFNPMQQ